VFNCAQYLNQLDCQKTQNDIVICNHFADAKKIAHNCRKTRLWNQCFYIKTEYHRSYIETMNIIHRKNFASMMEESPEFIWNYDEVYLGTFNNIASIIAYRYCVAERKKLIIMDEGIASYTLTDFKGLFPKKQRLFRSIFGHIINPKYIESVKLYHPEWYCGDYNFSIEQIKPIDRNQTDFIGNLNTIFDYNNELEVIDQVIFFDQPLTISDHSGEYEKAIQRCVELFQKNNITYRIKWHPRTDESFRNHFGTVSEKTSSLGGWEMILLNQRHSTSKIYITPFSTAALLGKMLFNDDDIVIFLYKILNLNVPNIDKFVSNIQKVTANIYIPERWENIEVILANKDKINQKEWKIGSYE
jgi:hypothetical protein